MRAFVFGFVGRLIPRDGTRDGTRGESLDVEMFASHASDPTLVTALSLVANEVILAHDRDEPGHYQTTFGADSAKRCYTLVVVPQSGGERSDATLACELAPFLLTAIAPDIRPVSAQFMKPHEAQALRATVSTMASLGLSYAPPAEETRFSSRDGFRGGAPATLVLDPPIDELVLFGGGVPNVNNEPGSNGFHKSHFFGNGGHDARRTPHTHADKPRSDVSLVPRRFLPAGTKQMLAHEVRLETIRVAERAMHGPGTPPGKEKKEEKKGEDVSANKDAAKRRLATAMGGLGPTATKKIKKVDGGVAYKYNEGFTNAVRRAVYVRDLT